MALMRTLVSLLMVSLVMATLGVTTTMARDLPALINPTQSLAARLNGEGGGGMIDCWTALLELKSCTNEIIIFFVDGETHLGLECCKAIRIITQQCWPAMLTSLGFTAEEGDILQGYCDATSTAPPTPSAPAGPSQAPSGTVVPMMLG